MSPSRPARKATPRPSAAVSRPQRIVHYVLSTHWDREWYQSFQNYRYQLVHLIDHVLGGLANGKLRGPFQVDGQAIPIEDYLEIRPERRAEVIRRARTGKLVIGPWYVLPDEFIVSGESLVRNLGYGRSLARALGGDPSNAGFACDLFGQNSQMPQIFAGFGIRGGFVWRGTNVLDSRNVIWVGADGTEMPCYRFGPMAYCDYAVKVRRINRQEIDVDPIDLDRNIEEYIRGEAPLTEVDPILAFDGGDHQDWVEWSYEILARKMDEKGRDPRIIHSSLDGYLAEMLPQASRITRRVKGELREPGLDHTGRDEQWVIHGVLSSRVKHKQANAECQILLCHWAEPASALAAYVVGLEYPQAFLDTAWKWLIQNHPHDSICGCSIDQVHQDMMYRFSQCRQIADRLAREATLRIAASIGGDVPDNENRLVIFNPLPRPVREPVDLAVRVPTDWPKFAEAFGFEPLTSFTLHDEQGNAIDYQRTGQTNDRMALRVYPDRFAKGHKENEIRITVPLEIPAMGYRTLTVRRGEERKPVRHPVARSLATSHRSLENEFLSVAVEPNGTLTLTDKRTNQVYGGLLTFEDCADIGDGWYHGPAINDQVFTSWGSKADVAIECDGPLRSTLRIRTIMSVPARFDFGPTMRRSETLADVVIDSRVTLRRGVDRVEIESTVNNVAEDHRMRVLFPSGARSDEFFTDTPFDVVRRRTPLRADNHLYRELEVETKPQQSFTAVHDDDRGLAVISEGLMESAVRDHPERPIALTLFRGTRRTVLTDGEPDGQLRGVLAFRYWIVSLRGAFDAARLCDLGQRLAAGLRSVHLAPIDVRIYRQKQVLPPAAGLMRVEGPAVVTSARRVGEGLEIRLFNPAETKAPVSIHLLEGFDRSQLPHRALRVDFESNPLDEKVDYQGGIARLTLGPKKIVTLRLI